MAIDLVSCTSKDFSDYVHSLNGPLSAPEKADVAKRVRNLSPKPAAPKHIGGVVLPFVAFQYLYAFAHLQSAGPGPGLLPVAGSATFGWSNGLYLGVGVY